MTSRPSSVKCFQILEKKMKIKNSSNLVLVESQEEHLSDNMVIAPRLYYKSGHLYVIHEIKILQEFDSIIDAMVYLYGLYFVFDLKYPECFKQVLGIFHEFLFKSFQNVNVNRSVSYQHVVSLLNKHTHLD